jgi:homogentisate 1,2-dioxygenase
MPFVVRNVEADEVHFVQEGEVELTTDYGALAAAPGDFVFIPRGVSYRARPLSPSTLCILLEVPGAMRLDVPMPFGMINVSVDVHRPAPAPPAGPGGETALLLKCFEGVTRYVVPHDPLAAIALIGGQSPVWKVNLRRVAPVTYEPSGGAPAHFAATKGKEALLYTVSARRTGRAPIHVNADYDELILFHAGPGAYGRLNEPGLLGWVPKGITHHGAPEDVPEGYWAWMLETRATLRLTSAGAAAARLMETSLYGPHPSLAAR